MGGQVVDTLTAGEFMQQTLEKLSVDELGAIADAAERKSSAFRSALTGTPAAGDLTALLALMFGVRRKAPAVIDALGGDRAGERVAALLDHSVPVQDRVDAFASALDGTGVSGTDIASEFLHFSDPERYWLWTRWMWDPRTETGSLRLVTMDEFDLDGDTPGATYLRVGEGVAFVAETGRAAGFTRFGEGSFGIDVFLACVYGIYMYTVLRMRMTQEFNHVVPELPELARRLLGVWRLEG